LVTIMGWFFLFELKKYFLLFDIFKFPSSVWYAKSGEKTKICLVLDLKDRTICNFCFSGFNFCAFRWCQSGIIICCLFSAWFLNFYSYRVASVERALMRFGNNRQRMGSERRKIR
jgi:hypothetical protein